MKKTILAITAALFALCLLGGCSGGETNSADKADKTTTCIPIEGTNVSEYIPDPYDYIEAETQQTKYDDYYFGYCSVFADYTQEDYDNYLQVLKDAGYTENIQKAKKSGAIIWGATNVNGYTEVEIKSVTLDGLTEEDKENLGLDDIEYDFATNYMQIEFDNTDAGEAYAAEQAAANTADEGTE